uniref:hypothetical protein n=1 Tax=Hericium alpestre TaxID=135208 RepID=UPI00243577EB|nr:hypothetical protein QEO35_mgp06 [Hericium alpestre]WEX32027.1 hypothetical protein [Hericium alpestre]
MKTFAVFNSSLSKDPRMDLIVSIFIIEMNEERFNYLLDDLEKSEYNKIFLISDTIVSNTDNSNFTSLNYNDFLYQMFLCRKNKDPKNIFYSIYDNSSSNRGNLKPLFIFEDLIWSNIVFLLKMIEINISGGSGTHRHLLSTTQFDLFVYLMDMDIFKNEIYKLRKFIYNSYKLPYSKVDYNYKHLIKLLKNNDPSINDIIDEISKNIIYSNIYLHKYLNIINKLKLKISNKDININDLDIDINQIEVIKNYLIVFFPYFTSQNSEIINLLDKVKSLIINS